MMGPWRVGRSIGRDKGCKDQERKYTRVFACSSLSLVRVRIVQHVETRVYAAVKIVPRPRKSQSPRTIYGTPVVSEEDLRDLEREIATMKLVTHPNLLALYDVWESKRELYVVPFRTACMMLRQRALDFLSLNMLLEANSALTSRATLATLLFTSVKSSQRSLTVTPSTSHSMASPLRACIWTNLKNA